QAGAVPSIYVISPDWRLVGIFRGANDWDTDAVRSGLSELAEVKSVGTSAVPTAGAAAPAGAGSMPAKESLPSDLIPPEIVLHALSEEERAKVKVGQSFELQLSVTWKGKLSDYVFKVPRLTLPSEVVLENISSESTSDSSITYKYMLKVTKEGKYNLGPCELAYQSRIQRGGVLYSRSSEVELDLTPKQLKINKWWYVILVLMVLAGATGFGVHYFRKKKKLFVAKVDAREIWKRDFLELLQNLSEAFHQVESLKFKGDQKGYHLSLVELIIGEDRKIADYKVRFQGEVAAAEVLKRIAVEWDEDQVKGAINLIEGIRYGGRVLNELELDAYRRVIERILSIKKLF
ncbi:MAG: hypothetical protein HQK50_14865, partial [Oligoflexia bacterium]|nr:hypothetical protein [Oligoflexia bacterium]